MNNSNQSSPTIFESDAASLPVEKLDLKLKAAIRIEIPMEIHAQMLAYIRSTDDEVSGMGHAIRSDDGRYVIQDICLPEQTGSSAHTELDPKALATLMVSKAKRGDLRALNVWWHSHVNMGTFWSDTDDMNCRGLVKGKEWIVSLVACQDGSIRCRLDVDRPIGFYFDCVPIAVQIHGVTKAKVDGWKSEVKRNVKPSPLVNIKGMRRLNLEYGVDWKSEVKRGVEERTLDEDHPGLYGPAATVLRPYDKVHQPGKTEIIRPRPKRKRTSLDKIESVELGDRLDFPHNRGCHALRDRMHCEDCELMDCTWCQFNKDNHKLKAARQGRFDMSIDSYSGQLKAWGRGDGY